MDFILSVFDSVFPLRTPVKESDSLAPVHPVIPGESVLFLGEIRAGVISLSNYRYDHTKAVHCHNECQFINYNLQKPRIFLCN